MPLLYKCDRVGFYQIAFTAIFGIYIIFFPIHLSILKALRNLIVEKPVSLHNTAFYDFDFRTLLSSMPINKT